MSQAALITPTPYFSVSKSASKELQAPISNRVPVKFPSFVNLVNRFEYSDKVHFHFRVSEQLSRHFILIKGLIEFHRGADTQFIFDRNDRSFEVKTNLKHAYLLSEFLFKVEDWLVQELQFKSALKKIIRFEKQYKSQQKALYNSLLGI